MKIRQVKAVMCCLLILLCVTVRAQQRWETVNGGLGSGQIYESVTALLSDTTNHVLYAGGSYTTMNESDGCDGFTIWDGMNWTINYQYVPGVTNDITSIVLYNGKGFVSGKSGNVSSFIWSNWNVVGSFDGSVTSLCVYHDKLYAGGQFTSVNGVTAYRIACYDGVKWDSVGGGVYWSQACCSSVEAMCVWRDKLVVGGTFDRAVNPDGSEIPAGSIALWNDTSWSAIGEMTQQTTGVNTGYLFSLGVYKGDLIAGGGSQFDFADGVSVRGIARYDGSNWYSLANGVNNEVRCMIEKDSSLYVGGSVYIGNTDYDSYGVLRWDGMNFNKIDSGLGNVNALAIYDDVLYAGGSFNKRGMKNIARLVPDTVHVSVTPLTMSHPPFTLVPNPVTDKLEMINGKLETGDVVTVTDLCGRVMERKEMMNPTSIFKLQTINYPPGMYLLSVRTKEGIGVTKFVKQ